MTNEKLELDYLEENQKIYESTEDYKKEKFAKERFFANLAEKVLKDFEGASVEDVLLFADKLKKWAIMLPFKLSTTSVQEVMEKESFYRSKF